MEIGKSCFENIFENFYGNLLELNLCMKDCQSCSSMFFVSQHLLGYKYLESLIYYLLPVQHQSLQLELCYHKRNKASHFFILKLISTKKPSKLFCTGSNFVIVKGIYFRIYSRIPAPCEVLSKG